MYSFIISVSEKKKSDTLIAVGTSVCDTFCFLLNRPVNTISEGLSAAPDSLWRRYSEFELLRNYLLVTFPYIVVPPLPEKRAEFVWHKLSADNMDPDFVERRRIGLENFLLRVASHSVLSKDKIFYLFLTQDDGWKDVVYDTGFQAKVMQLFNLLCMRFVLLSSSFFLPCTIIQLCSLRRTYKNNQRYMKSPTKVKNHQAAPSILLQKELCTV
ncbi:SNX4 protein, partial [Polyodon spathula]|nr:SNX4 protein [Polyodon spathula]